MACFLCVICLAVGKNPHTHHDLPNAARLPTIHQMIKQIVHWLVAAAVVLQLFSCIFLGQGQMPGLGF